MTADVKRIGGSLNVEYYQMHGSLLARLLAWELCGDGRPGTWAAMDAFHLKADSACMYIQHNQDPMIIRKNDIVVMVCFSQYDDCDHVPDEEWSSIICVSV